MCSAFKYTSIDINVRCSCNELTIQSELIAINYHQSQITLWQFHEWTFDKRRLDHKIFEKLFWIFFRIYEFDVCVCVNKINILLLHSIFAIHSLFRTTPKSPLRFHFEVKVVGRDENCFFFSSRKSYIQSTIRCAYFSV